MSNERQKTIQCLKSEKLLPKKMFGQHFLVDDNIINKIADSCNVEGKECVEIGGGLGSLTEKLAMRAEKLVVYEIDRNLSRVLKQRFRMFPAVLVVCEDFLRVKMVENSFSHIFGNLPYNISVLILVKLIEEPSNVVEGVVMIQKEVAKRIVALPGTKTYGALTAIVQHVWNVEYLFEVGKQAFIPEPKIDSAVIKFSKKAQVDKHYIKFVKRCFEHRRKKLTNNLIKYYNKTIIEKIFLNNNINLSVRAEQLSPTVLQMLHKKFDLS